MTSDGTLDSNVVLFESLGSWFAVAGVHETLVREPSALRNSAHFALAFEGLRLGDAVFTTGAMHRGVPVRFERHWMKVTRDAYATFHRWEPDAGRALQLLRALHLASGLTDAVFRLYVVRHHPLSGGWDEDTGSRLWVVLSPRQSVAAIEARAAVVVSPRVGLGPFEQSKTTSYQIGVLAALERSLGQAEEALVLNELGRVARAATGNVFVCSEGRWRTPATSEGCQPGVTRETVIGAMLAHGIGVDETIVTRADLDKATGAFVTRSLAGVIPLQTLNGRELSREWEPNLLPILVRATSPDGTAA